MKYANGREVKVGDLIVQRDYYGVPTSGYVMRLFEGDRLMCVPTDTKLLFNSKDCLHLDDVFQEPDLK